MDEMAAGRSDALVFFGITGDLAYKQIIPALQAMVQHGRLEMPVIGVAKSGWDLEQVRARVRESLQEHGGVDEAALAALLARLHYIDGDYADPATFERLRAALGTAARPLHYLAIPPSLFATVAERVSAAGCANNARVMIEKPFGHDLASARELNRTLHRYFPEAALLRIDHYIDKESFLNMLYFRIANTFVEPIWNRDYIASVQITMAESFGIHGRGRFYEETGAIRDVIQNHVLQVASNVAMEPLHSDAPHVVSAAKEAAFERMRPLDPAHVVRGQFRGYRQEDGVAAHSTVETFAALCLFVDSERWDGVPFYLRAGKCLPVTCTEVLIKLKHPAPVLARHKSPDQPNYLRFRLSPEEAIAIGVRVKAPGDAIVGEPAELIAHHQPAGDELPYERLLWHASLGDRAAFASEKSIEAAWRVVDPILGAATPLHTYEPGTWGPREAERIAAADGGWHNPAPAATPTAS